MISGANLLTASLVIGLLVAFKLTHVLSLNVWFVIPVGASIVGFLCGAGAMAASYFVGVRLSIPVLIAAGVFQLLLYGGFRLIEFNAFYATLDPQTAFPDLSLWQFFQVQMEDRVAELLEAFSLHRTLGDAVPGMAIVFRLIQVVGFVYGSLLGLHWLSTRPRCESCARYMRTKLVMGIPVSISDAVNATEEQDQAVWDGGHAQMLAIFEAVTNENDDEIKSAIATAREFAVENRRRGFVRLVLDHCFCTGCGEGALVATLVNGEGDQQQTEVVHAVQTQHGPKPGVLYA